MFGTIHEPIALSPRLLGALDLLRSEMESDEEQAVRHDRMVATVATVAGTTLTVGFVTWLIRSGVLLATALTTTPLWRPLDPVPILASGRREIDEEGRAGADETASGVRRGPRPIARQSGPP